MRGQWWEMRLEERPGARTCMTLEVMVETIFYSKCDGRLLYFIQSIRGSSVLLKESLWLL